MGVMSKDRSEWGYGQWNIYVRSGATPEERRARLAEVPEERRAYVEAYVRLVFRLRADCEQRKGRAVHA